MGKVFCLKNQTPFNPLKRGNVYLPESFCVDVHFGLAQNEPTGIPAWAFHGICENINPA